MSAELVPVSDSGLPAERDERIAALERLAAAAETAPTAESAREIMIQGKAIADALSRSKAEFDLSWKAGKASVIAGRRLGVILGELSPDRVPLKNIPNDDQRRFNGSLRSERRRVGEELGMIYPEVRRLVLLGKINDPDFQRYLQSSERIPSIRGCFEALGVLRRYRTDCHPQQLRRRKAKIRIAKNPNDDQGYNHIRMALSHLDRQRGGSPKKTAAFKAAVDLLYEAEDLLKPYRGGYVK